ncbi:MAG TPA: acyltransferase family protein [Xanthobacteraceae bacterium]|nr:acyltransferase family protein [Xanthobacteraceae bacterium]
MSSTVNTHPGRVDWVDYAKGICIIMVVMMHSTLGVEAAAGREGFMHAVVAFAKPFRMPDFFLISGLFLAQVIDRDWRTYLDRKVVHFAYFYVLWCTIQFAFKAPGMASEMGVAGVVSAYAMSFIEPFGTLWFIYLLPIFFVVTKLARNVSPWVVFAITAALEIAPIATGWTVIDEFAGRFVYFYAGYWLAPHIFALARTAGEKPWHAGAGLVVWALVNGALVATGYSDLPAVGLLLGAVGAAAVVVTAALLAKFSFGDAIRYCGENSIVIYLGFFLPMAITRTLLLKSDIPFDVGTVSLIVTTAGVVGALMMWWALRNSPLWFLYKRPEALHIAPSRRITLQPAE